MDVEASDNHLQAVQQELNAPAARGLSAKHCVGYELKVSETQARIHRITRAIAIIDILNLLRGSCGGGAR